AANQIPLLTMADQPLAPAQDMHAAAAHGPAPTSGSASASGSVPASGDSLQQLLALRRTGAALTAAPQLVLVGFNDPNDLLSYTLPPKRYDGAGVAVYNILVSNGATWLGLLERPDQAHLDYLYNPDVDRLIVCGQPASARCAK
ncbi:MAG: hypothetical protein V4578_04630, partial [Pseudomonadota bacterium]